MTERDRQTGRYKHLWAMIGPDVAECDHCGKCTHYRTDADKIYRDREAVRRAGIPLFEGY